MEAMNQCAVTIEPMTKAEFLGKEKRLTITYSIFTIVSLGKFLVASTSKGVCFLMPGEKRWNPVEELKRRFPKARLRFQKLSIHRKAAYLVCQRYDKVEKIALHLYGTSFQIAVWKDLLTIPAGKVTTYLDIAKRIGNPRGARAVGGAVGSNPVLSIIPCHRVICSSGKLGGFHWGIDKKIKLLNKEARGSKKREGAYNWEPTFF